jgi:hypothetical protein
MNTQSAQSPLLDDDDDDDDDRRTIPMVSLEHEIMQHLPAILRNADLEKSTVKSLQHELEQKLGFQLGAQKGFIRDQVRA